MARQIIAENKRKTRGRHEGNSRWSQGNMLHALKNNLTYAGLRPPSQRRVVATATLLKNSGKYWKNISLVAENPGKDPPSKFGR